MLKKEGNRPQKIKLRKYYLFSRKQLNMYRLVN